MARITEGQISVIAYPNANTLFLLAILFVVGLMLFLILYCKIHAFFALLFSSLTLGLLTGMPPHAIVTVISEGDRRIVRGNLHDHRCRSCHGPTDRRFLVGVT